MNPLLFSAKALLEDETANLLSRVMKNKINVKLTVDDAMCMAVGLMTIMELNKTNNIVEVMGIKEGVDDFKTKELMPLVEKLNDKITNAFEEFGVELTFGEGMTRDELEEFTELMERMELDGDLVD